MIEIKFVSKIDKDKMFEALGESAKKEKYMSDYNLELGKNRMTLRGYRKICDECRYEETENGIIFRTDWSGHIAKMAYYHFPRTFKHDAYILFDRETYFYSFDEFLKIEKGKVYKMKLEDIREIQYEVKGESIRGDILDAVEESME